MKINSNSSSKTSNGLFNGLLGVLIFSATLPMSRIAVQEMSPWFVTFGRAAIAGLLALAWLYLQSKNASNKEQWIIPPAHLRGQFFITALGVVLGFPLFSTFAMQNIPASHGAIVTGLLPLATALIAAWISHERLKRGFWICAVIGSALVLAFAWRRGAGSFHWGDGLMLLAVISGALGYAHGGKLAKQFDGARVICAALVLSLPISLPLAILTLDFTKHYSTPVWGAFVYVSVMSMWVGFFFWYRGLAQGGVAKIGQVQLLQPFFTLLCASVLLGEVLDAEIIFFALAVIATIAVGRRLSS
jgi:drug/metabolite transporter (DMT)-like permease